MNKKEIQIINHVSDLLNFVENDNNNYFFRGESKNYKNTKLTPNLYRYDISLKHYSNPIKEYEKASRMFFKEIGGTNKRDTDNFMAFCQHHSIPTPLLDITTSPLIGLYFAVSSNLDNDGYVYLFDDTKFVNYDNSFLKYGKDLSNFPFLGEHYKKIVSSIGTYINESDKKHDYFINKVIPDYMNKIRDYLNKFETTDVEAFKKRNKNLIDAKNMDDLRNIIVNSSGNIYGDPKNFSETCKLYFKYIKSFGISRKNNFYCDENNVHLMSVVSFAEIFGFLIWLFKGFYISGDGYIMPPGLIFYTSTTTSWDRIKAQSGKFIVAIPNNSDISVNDKNDGVMHYKYDKPTPDYTFVVNFSRKKTILRELDLLGINEKNLFLDIDHTASYITQKVFH